MADDLEGLAARGRGARDKRAEIAARKAEARARRITRVPSELLDRSLAPSRNFITALMVFCVVATIGATVAVARLELGNRLFVLSYVGGFFVTMGVLFGYERVHRWAQYRWLDSLPFELQGYLGVLRASHSGRRRLRATVRFERPVPEAERELITDAMFGALGFVDMEWQGESFVLRSGELETSVGTGYTSRDLEWGRSTGSKPHNGALHAWFRRTVDRGLRKLHRRYPIASVAAATELP